MLPIDRGRCLFPHVSYALVGWPWCPAGWCAVEIRGFRPSEAENYDIKTGHLYITTTASSQKQIAKMVVYSFTRLLPPSDCSGLPLPVYPLIKEGVQESAALQCRTV